MKILLVDNTKNNLCNFTRLLEQKLRNFTKNLVVCDDIKKINEILTESFDAIVLSGSSLNLSQPNKIEYFNKSVNILLRFPNIPVLGICFGMQLIVSSYGGHVSRLENNNNKEVAIRVDKNSILFGGVSVSVKVTLSHQDYVNIVPPDFEVYSKHGDSVQVVESLKYLRFGVQFHPEKNIKGEEICVLSNFFKFLNEKNTIPGHLSLEDYYKRIFSIKNSGRIVIDRNKETLCEKFFWMELWNQHRYYWDIPAMLVC